MRQEEEPMEEQVTADGKKPRKGDDTADRAIKLSDLLDFKQSISGQFDEVKQGISGLNGSVGSLTQSVQSIQESIANLNHIIEAKHEELAREVLEIRESSVRTKKTVEAKIKQLSGEIQLLKQAPEACVSDTIRRQVQKEMDKVKAIAEVSKTRSDTTHLMDNTTPSQQSYWRERKSIRGWPVRASNDKERWTNLGNFFADKMRIPAGVLMEKDVEAIRKVAVRHTRNRTDRSPPLVHDEVLVTFANVEIRDVVASYAWGCAAVMAASRQRG